MTWGGSTRAHRLTFPTSQTRPPLRHPSPQRAICRISPRTSLPSTQIPRLNSTPSIHVSHSRHAGHTWLLGAQQGTSFSGTWTRSSAPYRLRPRGKPSYWVGRGERRVAWIGGTTRWYPAVTILPSVSGGGIRSRRGSVEKRSAETGIRPLGPGAIQC